MGWTYLYKSSSESTKDYLTTMWSKSGRYRVLDSVVYLKVAYLAIQDTQTNEVFASVILLDYHPQGGCNFGYKDMDESCGPNESNCPERLLKLLTPTDNAYALEWRERCRKHIEHKKTHTLAPGDRIRFVEPLRFTDGTEVSEFVYAPDRRHKNVFRSTETGRFYRIPNATLREWEKVEKVS